MEKIPTIFDRGADFKVTDKPRAGCEWVFAGEGRVTEKIDGTNIQLIIRDFRISEVCKRRNPTRAEKENGAEPGYVPAFRTDPADKWILAAVDWFISQNGEDMGFLCPTGHGEISCEAYGHKIQGDPLKIGVTKLYLFKEFPFTFVFYGPRNYETIKEFLRDLKSGLSPELAEGIVFHHPDGRMAKIKRKDFKY